MTMFPVIAVPLALVPTKVVGLTDPEKSSACGQVAAADTDVPLNIRNGKLSVRGIEPEGAGAEYGLGEGDGVVMPVLWSFC